MIVGLENFIPHMIKSSTETKINADWLKEELIDCLRILYQSGFIVRALFCNNHPSHVPCFKNLLQHFNQDPHWLFTWHELIKTYLFYNTAHLVKNIRDILIIINILFILNWSLMVSRIPSTVQLEKYNGNFFMTFTRKMLF